MSEKRNQYIYNMHTRTLALLILLSLIISCTSGRKSSGHIELSFDPFNYSITKNATGTGGAVVSAHPLASKAGIYILKKGGNAIDAAIATQLALAVVYPGAGNLGGGGFMVAHLANGKNLALDYRETAPSGAYRDMYLDSLGNPRTELSQNGHLAAGVPGTVAGISASLKYAKLPLKELIAPAIELAEKGFSITAGEASSLNYYQSFFKKYNTVQPVFIRSTPWKAGDTLIQLELAGTLKRIRDLGADGFYKGKTARFIVEEMNRAGGIISMEDLANYKAVERAPVSFDYRGNRVISMSLPSAGGIMLQQMLKMVEDKPLKEYGFLDWRAVQLMTEVERRSYADRAQFLGDIDFEKVPVQDLVSKQYLEERMSNYTPEKAGHSGNIKEGILPESEETTHISIYDAEGNAVAVTTTLNGSYGSGTVVAGAGFLLNNEMDDFSIKPGVPNMYGAIGAEANAIRPGKRMLSSMSPTIVLKDGKPWIITGTPGGTTITTSVFQTLVNIIDFGMNAADAVNKPKFHHQWLPDMIYVERTFPKETREKLQSLGYTIRERSPIGRTELIIVNSDGSLQAAADSRGEDHVEISSR